MFGGKDGATLALDEKGLLRAVETVAFSHTKFEILEVLDRGIARVKTQEYLGESLYVDLRFLQRIDHTTQERPCALPPSKIILEKMDTLLGFPYVWGGSFPGIPRMLEFYPPAKPLPENLKKIWTFHGVDCSGLLYWATDGFTPRNTSQLVTFGKSLKIENVSHQEIQKMVRPLDLLVWKGHVIIIINSEETIESRAGFGVVKRNLLERLSEIAQQRKPVNTWDSSESFVINRWQFS